MPVSLTTSRIHLSSLLLLSWLVACTAEISLFQDGGSASGSGSGGASTTGQGGGADAVTTSTATTGGQGGAAHCETAQDCPATLCVVASCDNGLCSESPEAYGTECGDEKACDGEGNCLLVNGSACGAGGACLSGFCTDDVCCEKACAGECESCARPGEEGLCRLHDAATDPDEECIDAGVCDGAGRCASGEHIFSTGVVSDGNQYAYDVVVDSQDNVIMTGLFFGSVDFGGGKLFNDGAYDYFIAKFDKTGKHLFSKQIRRSGQNNNSGLALAIGTNDNIILGGHFTGTIDMDGDFVTSVDGYDAFIMALDANGAHVWGKVYGGSGDQRITAVTADANGNIYAAGQFSSSINFDGNSLTATDVDAFLTKFDGTGKVVWAKDYGEQGNDFMRAVEMDPQGNIIASGYFYGSVDMGFGTVSSVDNADVFVMRVAPDGTSLLAKHYGGQEYDSLRSMTVDNAGRVTLSGTYAGDITLGQDTLSAGQGYQQYVVNLDDKLEPLWAKSLASTDAWWAASPVASDSSGNVFVGRTINATIMDENMQIVPDVVDMVVTKFASDGTRLWSHLLTGAGGDYLSQLATDSGGAVWLTGYFEETLSLGGTGLTSSSGFDVFLGQLSP